MLDSNFVNKLKADLSKKNQEFLKHYPGDSSKRQPVHSFYGGAHLFKSDSALKLSQLAVQSMTENAENPDVFSNAMGFNGTRSFNETIYERVLNKLKKEAIEDYHIDFEDGYGSRADDEEDGHAKSVALEVAKGHKEGTLPPYIGIRIKPLNDEVFSRSIRTLDIFISTMLNETKGVLPSNFVVTLPKITVPEQVDVLVQILEKLDPSKDNQIPIEFMVETQQSIFAANGTAALQDLVKRAKGRCVGAHFGTYDYTASSSITAAYQSMDHKACDFARTVMQVTLAGTGIFLSDGATNVMPVGDRETVHKVWKLNFTHVRNSLVAGFYQGWDLHPAQLPVRYAAVYSFFLENLPQASARLKAFVAKATQATLLGDVFDDAATGQGLLNYFLRAINCGAITESEALATGLTLEEIRSRSFHKIMEARRKSGSKKP